MAGAIAGDTTCIRSWCDVTRCALVTGKWVVSPKYIECSYKAKKWLEAERFVVRSVGSGNLKKLSEVPTRWLSFRQQNGSQGPFSSWRVLLALFDADKIRYKR